MGTLEELPPAAAASAGFELFPEKLGGVPVTLKEIESLEKIRDSADIYEFPEEEKPLDLEADHEHRGAAEELPVDVVDPLSEIKRVTWQKQRRIPEQEEEEEEEDQQTASLKTTSVAVEALDICKDALMCSSAKKPPLAGSGEKKVELPEVGETMLGRERQAAAGRMMRLHSCNKSGSILVTRSPSFVGPISPSGSLSSSSCELQELVDMREKNKFLEAALKAKAMEVEAMKQELQEMENNLLDKIECLELANEQLLAGGENSGMEQLQMELTRLQKQNTLLAQRERELQFQLSTKDMLQKEVQHLQELNEQLQLDTRRLLPDQNSETGAEAAAGGGSCCCKMLLERIVSLETELAEAVEVNNLYKSQLHTAFAEQENVQAAVTHDDQVVQLKLQLKKQDSELQDIRDRFFVMSIRLAETEAQHEEALMKVKRLQNPLRHFGGSFKW
ncbi:unnamed protein product [Sphagnum jensenii]|uniref:Uncharacterized protein n=1 Tax=Sphagnum jensenii TaxID=128206 RepID=A0ABP1AMA9_9BRYO